MESIRAEYQLAKTNFISVRARLLTLFVLPTIYHWMEGRNAKKSAN
ncbi:MAG: hypothetical protein PF448_09100 [Bacteroidales bacterium]|jgi:hypothetical protein|nr:hypothetical protein [Bacteroidales bacterium]